MPSLPMRPCLHPGCRETVKGGYCAAHKRNEGRQRYQATRAFERERGSSSARGYDARWKFARDAFLRRNPLCAACERKGRVTPATEVDHIEPHRGDALVFWDASNLQALCKPCHSRKTAREVNARMMSGRATDHDTRRA